jgi:hypothetical protein
MASTLTIVARRPDINVSDETVFDEQDEPIRLIMCKLRGRTDPDHVVKRAAAMQEIAIILANHAKQVGAAPDVIQIVGHGLQGSLQLGDHWLENKNPPDSRAYTLDSNPNLYSVMFQRVKPPTSLVRILGCTVGDPTHSPTTTIVDGPTLLFDLTRMWGVPVDAPTDLISVDNFDDEGQFADPGHLVLAQDLEVTMPPDSGTHANPPAGETIVFETCVAVPCLRHLPVHPSSGDSPALARLTQLPYKQVRGRAWLAAPEIVFQVKWNGLAFRADVIGNSRLLRLHAPPDPGMIYFAITADMREQLTALIQARIRVPQI